MTWELHEVWSVDEDGHEELVNTTKSLKEARLLAKSALAEGAQEVLILAELGDGDIHEVERIVS